MTEVTEIETSPIVFGLSECVVRIYMLGAFNNDFTEIPGGEAAFDKIHTGYIDLSGIGMTKQFELILSIHNLNARITEIRELIALHIKSIEELDMPFVPGIEGFIKFGYRIEWDGDIDRFLKKLRSIDMQERVQHVYLADEKKKLEALENDGVKNDHDARKDFIKTLNRLGKEGYRIDKNQTTMEEMALMVLEYNEESTAKMQK